MHVSAAREVVFPAAAQVAVAMMSGEARPPGLGEVTVRAAFSAISPGTERALFTNTSGRVVYPYRPGYSLAGYVSAVGDGVEGFALGDPVCAWAPHASHVNVPVTKVVAVPTDVDLRHAALFHLGFVALLGVRRSRIEVGESVAVLGQGLLGLLTLGLARLQGALPLVALDLDDNRLARSTGYGADLTANPGRRSECTAVLASLLEGGPNVVIEVTGQPAAVDFAATAVRRLGRITLLGHQWAATAAGQPDTMLTVHRKGVEVIGAHTLARAEASMPHLWTWQDDARCFLSLIQHGRLEVASLITHQVPVDRAPEIYRALEAGDPTLIAGLLDWSAN